MSDYLISFSNAVWGDYPGGGRLIESADIHCHSCGKTTHVRKNDGIKGFRSNGATVRLNCDCGQQEAITLKHEAGEPTRWPPA